MRTAILASLAASLLLGAPARADERDDCLRRMEVPGIGIPAGELERCVTTIVAATEKGDLVAWRRLKAIITKEGTPALVRVAALRAAVHVADGTVAREILSLGKQWVADLDTSVRPNHEFVKDKLIRSESMLLTALIHEGFPALQELGEDPILLLLLHLAKDVAANEHLWISIEARSATYVYLATLPVSPAARRECVLSLLREKQDWQQLPPPLLAVLDAPALSELHKLLRDSTAEPQELHWSAATALAHHGVEEARPLIRDALKQSHGAGTNTTGMLQYYLWQIDVQNRPTGLLGYITSTERLESVETRMWAVRRAVELGVPKDKIREALLKHAQQVKPKTVRQQSGGMVTFWPGLSTLKEQGLKLGILHAGDLPEIQVSKLRPTP